MNEDDIKRFCFEYEGFETLPPNEYIEHFFKFKGGSVSIYKSGKAVFQGSDLEMFYDWIGMDESNKNKEFYDYDNYSVIGADEVGTGDVFGPITTAAVFVDKRDVETLKAKGVKDSKKLDDETIINIAEYIIKNFDYQVSICRNEIFNDNYKKYNMNAMKARLHNQNILILSKKVQFQKVCLDEFCSKENYFKYLDGEVFNNIQFETKGESKSIAVASASIVARYYFLKELDRIKKEYGITLPKGSSTEAQELIKKLKEENKEDLFYHIAKMNFKNFNK